MIMTKNLVKKTEFGINLKKYSYYLQEGPLGSDVSGMVSGLL